jgi:putative transposase
MFMDEAGFGRISEPKRCWCPRPIRPIVPRHHIREYRYAYLAADPQDGEFFSLVLPYANTICMNIFLDELSKAYPNDMILMPLDQASWHTAKNLVVPNNIKLFFLLPKTPELNPIEQVWKEIRSKGFRNEAFHTLSKVIDRLCETIASFPQNSIKSVIGRDWILGCFAF